MRRDPVEPSPSGRVANPLLQLLVGIACASVLAVYPLLFLTASNAFAFPADFSSLKAGFAVAAPFVAAIMAAARLAGWRASATTVWLCLTFLGLDCYTALQASPAWPWLAATEFAYWMPFLFLAGVPPLVTAAVRPWRDRERSVGPIAAICGVLLVFTVTDAIGPALAARRWKPAVQPLEAPSVARGSKSSPDIYYIVLDGFGRADVLRDLYNLDVQPFERELERNGVQVSPDAQSNYAQTYLSLASTLNLEYLDVSEIGGEVDRRPMKRLIDDNRLMNLARHAGYRVVAIGSDYSATRTIRAADSCYCRTFAMTDLHSAALAQTPFSLLPVRRWATDAHRASVMSAFASLVASASVPGPKLVFAHIIAPHPPFVFKQDGSLRQYSSEHFRFNDGDEFDGSSQEYVAGYRDQASFIASMTMRSVEAIRRAQGGADAAIVIHGDHGPGSRLHWIQTERTDLRERMSIFAAYALPGAAGTPLPASPVNGTRMLANLYFGTSLPMLPDVSYFSSVRRPYQLSLVTTGTDASSRLAPSR